MSVPFRDRLQSYILEKLFQVFTIIILTQMEHEWEKELEKAMKKAGITNFDGVSDMDLIEIHKSGSIDMILLMEHMINLHNVPSISKLGVFPIDLNAPEEFIRFPCPVLSQFFGRSINTHSIIEFSGESGSGKTQFCLKIALTCALPLAFGGCEKQVLYICTEGSFPINRFSQLLSLYQGVSYTEITNRVLVKHISTMDQLITLFKGIRSENSPELQKCRLIVVDSIAALCRTSDDDESSENPGSGSFASSRSRQFACIMKLARSITTSNSQNPQPTAVIFINQVTASHNVMKKSSVPALGLAWTNCLNTRFFLKKLPFSIGEFLESNPSLSKNFLNDISSSNTKVRSIECVFCPSLPKSLATFYIGPTNLNGLSLQQV